MSRANDLDGRTWTRYSISVWSDLKKTPEEMALGHPAMFPAALPERLIDCFTTAADHLVLDPFAGVGSTLLAAASRGKRGIGIELSEDYAAVALRRLRTLPTSHPSTPNSQPPTPNPEWRTPDTQRPTPNIPCLFVDDARNLARYVEPGCVDLVVTSPPYWDVLLARRTADFKAVRNYGERTHDLGRIADYDSFLNSLEEVFTTVLGSLRPGAYCCVVVMDLRKKARFYPLHSDLAERMLRLGYLYDDLIVWDRRHEYNHMRPLGYPAVFRVNKAHEFILIFQKPR